MRFIVGLLAVMLFITPVWARTQTIELKNGDKISGDVIAEDEGSVTLKTEAMGQITVDKDFVKPEEPKAVETAAAKEVEWKKKISLGYSKVGGNTETGEANAGVQINRKTSADEWTFKGDAYYAEENKKMSSKKFYGMGRYAYSFGRDLRWYHFYKLEAEHDRFANIDYRLIPSSGVGYWFSDTDDFKAMTEAAIGYEHTNYRDSTKDSNAAVLIPRGFLQKTVWKDLVFAQDLTLYPSLNDSGEFHLRSETALINPVTEKMAWKISFVDEYNSEPAAPTKKNDFRLISSVDYQF